MQTVLIVDADPELRVAYISVLSSNGFQVETAVDSLGCLAKLRQFVPDLLIKGQAIPGISLLGNQSSFQDQRADTTSPSFSRH